MTPCQNLEIHILIQKIKNRSWFLVTDPLNIYRANPGSPELLAKIHILILNNNSLHSRHLTLNVQKQFLKFISDSLQPDPLPNYHSQSCSYCSVYFWSNSWNPDPPLEAHAYCLKSRSNWWNPYPIPMNPIQFLTSRSSCRSPCLPLPSFNILDPLQIWSPKIQIQIPTRDGYARSLLLQEHCQRNFTATEMNVKGVEDLMSEASAGGDRRLGFAIGLLAVHSSTGCRLVSRFSEVSTGRTSRDKIYIVDQMFGTLNPWKPK